MKIDSLFSTTKGLKHNDAKPSGRKPSNPRSQSYKKDWIDKKMVKMIKLEAKRTRTENNTIRCDQTLRHW